MNLKQGQTLYQKDYVYESVSNNPICNLVLVSNHFRASVRPRLVSGPDQNLLEENRTELPPLAIGTENLFLEPLLLKFGDGAARK